MPPGLGSGRRPPRLTAAERRLVLMGGLILFVEFLFYAAVLPLLPGYSREYGLSEVGTGVLVGMYSAGIIASSLPSLYLARRWDFRVVGAIGVLVLGGATIVFGFGSSIVVLDSARFVQGIGGGLAWIGALGWVAAGARIETRGTVIGGAMAIAITGAMLGPVAGGLAVAAGPEVVFCALAVAQVTLGVVILRTEDRMPTTQEAATSKARLGSSAVGVAMMLVLLPALLAGVYEVLTPLRLDAAGGSAGLITAVFVAAAVVEALGGPIAGRISDRRGRVPPIRVALAAAPLLCVALTAGESPGGIAVLAVLAWLAIATAWTPGLALVGDLAGHDARAASRHWALLNVVAAGGLLAGSTLGAALAERWGDAVPYVVIGVGCLWAVIDAPRIARRLGGDQREIGPATGR